MLLARVSSGAALQPGLADQVTPAPLVCCPTDASYVAIVDAFARGDQDGAAKAIAAAPESRLLGVVSTLATRDDTIPKAAAAMHLVFAVRAADHGEDDLMRLQLNCAGMLLEKVARDPEFVTTGYMAAIQVLLDAADFHRAREMVRAAATQMTGFQALGQSDRALDARLRLADGLVNETEADALARGVALKGLYASIQQQFSDDLDAAETAYRAAFRLAPTMIEAELRLGRVLWLRGRGPEARGVLESVCDTSKDPDLTYLAHLFLADVALTGADGPRAAREYRAAIAAGPDYATPYLGISNLAQQAGDTQDAIRYVSQWSAKTAGRASTRTDPWVLYGPGSAHLIEDVSWLVRKTSR